MLENLDLSLSLKKDDYKEQMNDLMYELRSLHQQCWNKNLTLIIVLEGWAAAGKGKMVKKLATCMDPRGFILHPVVAPTPYEQQYPFLWRFWQGLPAKGNVATFYHSWYTHVLEDRLLNKVQPKAVPSRIQAINSFERQLAQDGIGIAKFWVHLSQEELQKRLKKYAQDPLDSWRVRQEDWQQHKYYEEYSTLAEEMLTQTSTGIVPWTLIPGDNKRWARVQLLSHVASRLRELLERPSKNISPVTSLDNPPPEIGGFNALSQVDLSQSLSKKSYKKQLKQQQIKLRKLQRSIYEQNVPVLAMFEGWDAAGKGGAIKRLTDVLDPRSYQVHPFAAPTDEEKAHHYLWRFWRKLPPAGKIGIFDRSWYGRVLVERVEGFASEIEWQRAYQEINEFEAQLINRGYVLLKFWIHIDPDEQLKRFQQRQEDPFKQHKITEEDWRNRAKWDDYELAVNQMVERTNTAIAPWTIVPANDKYYARVKVIETLTQAIENKLIS
ncbi:polyphosphate:AMP phosphotransferase [Euhalothece natronophila Z-M001]|uniref:Polyphosphate:AMP phosphotransferase n=1 Tax=Euhalothece natronophila Z-M001 TaxID=522448 RepID=A0A5B8NJJ1_9CHRO|nr:polyphosphate:AMP phosphotransferase [Euhalothece natronophila]QDZ39483.1 polyphosphate:AMP phosphotransferase [Euhalothece natronophila Z-M001]